MPAVSASSVTVEARYFVCINGQPVGHMYDQFEAGELRQPFPFRSRQNNFTDEFEAADYADKMKAHIAEVVGLPENKKRNRSASTWRL